jgi:hypothetical protein
LSRRLEQALEAELAHTDAPALAPAHPYDLDEHAPPVGWPARPERTAPQIHPPIERTPLDAEPHVDERPFLARTLRAAATVFSAAALIAVGALLIFVLVGDDWAIPLAEEATPAGQASVAGARPTIPPTTAKSDAAPAATDSSKLAQEASGVPPERHVATSGSGMVRAAGTQEASLQPEQSRDDPPARALPESSVTNSGSAADPAFSAPPGRREAPATQETDRPTLSSALANERSAARDTAVKMPERVAEPPAGRARSESPPAPTRSAATPRSTPATTQSKPRTAPVTSDVNMRASADNDAAVVAVVPNGKSVRIVECTRWCEVVYGEKQGFIHRRFLSGAGE